MESESEEHCKVCGKEKLNLNKVNWERHKLACETKQKVRDTNKRKKKAEVYVYALFQFFPGLPVSWTVFESFLVFDRTLEIA